MPRRPDRDHREPLPVDERELLDAADVGVLFGVSRTTVSEWNREELMPRPVRIRGSVRWVRRELIEWVKAKCPSRSQWKWSAIPEPRLDSLLNDLNNRVWNLTLKLEEINRARSTERLRPVHDR